MFRSRIFWRLFGAYTLLLLGAVGLLGLVLEDRFQRYYQHQVNERLRTATSLVRELVLEWPASKLPQLQERTQKLGQELAARITVITADGQVLADSDEDPARMENHGNRPEIQEARDHGYGSATRFSHTLDKPMKYLALRMDTGPGNVGFVRVALAVDDVEEQLAGLRRIIWTVAGLTALGAIVPAFWAVRRITSRLEELTRNAERIAAGKYGHRVYAIGTDEVGTLARTFNHMSEELARQFTQLDADRQQLRTILGSMVEGVIALDAEERIVFANDRAGRLLNFRASAMVGRKLWEAVRHPTLRDLVLRAMQGGEDCHDEINPDSAPGKSLTVQVACLPGSPARGVVLVLHDTSELRRLERIRQEFVANVSHELKTPLSVIKACIETLQDGAMDDPQHRDRFIARVADQAERLHALILDLLSLARIESSSEACEYQSVALEPLVLRCIERHRARAESKNQRLSAERPVSTRGENGTSAGHDDVPADGSPVSVVASPVAAWGDEEAVSQILDNLVDNALKYTPAGGDIRVRWRSDDGHACVDVEDTGIGIPETDLPRIFERFYRVDKARSRELGGTGLGLSIVKHLVQAMHGTVSASSTLGKGTKFTVRLPSAALVQVNRAD
jgi:two-component system phosphate regulon sensor histidine kinase PhoR